MMPVLPWLLAFVLPWAYVLPAERVLEQVAKARSSMSAVRLQVIVETTGSDGPREVQIELHPRGGVRVDDLDGGRWVVRGGRVVAASRSEVPVWLPLIEVVGQSGLGSLRSLLSDAGVDVDRSSLTRCGADDCFVIGAPERSTQLWVEKDGFEPRAWVTPTGKRFELVDYRSWGEINFPSQINVLDEFSRVATLRVLSLEPAPGLRPDDFSVRWTRL